jgi:hypothetical protein
MVGRGPVRWTCNFHHNIRSLRSLSEVTTTLDLGDSVRISSWTEISLMLTDLEQILEQEPQC